MKNYLFVFMTCFIFKTFSQNQNAQPMDVGEWETIYTGDISNNGKWIFYKSSTEAEKDTLIIKKIEGGNLLKIAKGTNASFTKDSKFVTAQVNFKAIAIVDLQNNKISKLEGFAYRDLTKDESYLIARKQSAINVDLVIHNFSDGNDKYLYNLMGYSIHPSKNEIGIIENQGEKSVVQILNIETGGYELLKESVTHNFKDIAWSEDGNNITFYELPKAGMEGQSKVYSCNGTDCKYKDISHLSGFGKIKMNNGFTEISQLSKFVFFQALPDTLDHAQHIPKGVQIWSGYDKYIYPYRKMTGLLEKQPYCFNWNTETDLLHTISDTTLTEFFTVNKDYILKIDKLAYQPQFKYVGDVDFYLYNLHTGKEQEFLKKQNPEKVFVDPDGEFIVFFRQGNWHSFNLETKNFVNLSHDLKTSFLNANADRPNFQTSYSRRIKWLEDEDAILLCDEFDVWKFSLDGKNRKKLTNGREINRKYAPVDNLSNPKKNNIAQVNSKKGLLFHALDDNRNEGYFLLPPKRPLIKLACGPFMADGIQWDDDLNYFIFRIQSYGMSPKIVLYDRKTDITTTLIHSNQNKNIVEWGNQELVKFSLKDGSPSKYVLIYPTNYDPANKYPMIVNIYENQSREMHWFQPLSDFGTAGFNPTHYTRDGYFILMPDIKYEIGNPGISALKYVQESMDHVIQNINIDTTKIGLYGFSYGGYESAFIATQTDRFAAIVSGAAITNLVTYYHAINWGTGMEEMWRMEDYQMRMGKPYFEIKEEYIKNSPFHNIENLNTPILLWAGAKDYHIDYNESIRFYLALRRLKKKVELLLFEEEPHNIIAAEKREYLGLAIKDWFDKYCKI